MVKKNLQNHVLSCNQNALRESFLSRTNQSFNAHILRRIFSIRKMKLPICLRTIRALLFIAVPPSLKYFLAPCIAPTFLLMMFIGCGASKRMTNASSESATLSSIRQSILDEASAWLGVEYRYRGTNKSGVDCSGFVLRVYESAGMRIPRTTKEQFTIGEKISRASLLPGDLVFFQNTAGKGISHVGIYFGNGKFIHASTTRGVILSDLNEAYYLRHFAGARQVLH